MIRIYPEQSSHKIKNTQLVMAKGYCLQVIADHIRAVAFVLQMDNFPDAGQVVVRRILRRHSILFLLD